MATIKKTTYVNTELEWAEEQLKSWRAYVDANPLHELKDRIEWKPTSKGGTMPMVIASIEQQVKSIRDTLKDYAYLCEAIDKLREKENQKVKARGNQQISGLNQLP